MSLSGADVDFWVDLDHSLGSALIEAAKFRPNPIVCISVKGKPSGLLKGKRFALPPLGEEVIKDSPVPVLVIGQETDTSRGLPLTEIVVSTDGSPAAEEVFTIGADMARDLKLIFTLVGVVHDSTAANEAEQKYLADKAESLKGRVPEVRHHLIKAADPAAGLIGFMETRQDAILAMSTHGRSGVNRSALGSVALKVVGHCQTAVLLRRPN